MSDSLLAFFDSYRRAYDSLDADAIAEHLCLPCAISDIDGNRSYSERKMLIAKFRGNCDTFREMDYESARYQVRLNKALGADAALVDLGWTVTTRSGEFDFGTVYLCHREEGPWRIFAAEVYGDEPDLRAR
jgi:hypothetical protein